MNSNTPSQGSNARRVAAHAAGQRTSEQRTGNRPAAAKRAAKAPGRVQAHKAQQGARRTAAKASPAKALFKARRRAGRKPRAPRNNSNLKTALWLWCFPVGLSLMWRRNCTWRTGVKAGISAAMAAILLAIIIAPVPRADMQVSGVQMVSGNPEVEVYGPALPSLIVPGYTTETTGSIIVDAVETDIHYVYAADGARCYHEYECKFAFASSQRLTVYEAYFLGFEPCGRCKPPVYTPGDEVGGIGGTDTTQDAGSTAAA